MPAIGVAATWPSPANRLLHGWGISAISLCWLFADESAPAFLFEKASLFPRDPIYSSGYIRRVPVKGADLPRNEAHGMCFEFAGKDAG